MSIQIQKISKSFGELKIIDNVSIDFAEGELTALLGPSGSGKTTLLRLIAGLETFDENCGGKILFNDRDVVQQHVRDRQVGFVFQHYALFRHLSVFENIAFGLRVKKRNERPSSQEINETVHELLGLVQLENMANRLPSQLSGGQRQRVALARALAIRPKVLLLDEPFGALDAKVRADLRRWLRDLHDKLGFTSIFVTHDQEEALEVSDRIVVLHRGKVEQIGTPEEVFHNPATEFVMRFFGEVNIFQERLVESNNEKPFFVRPHDFEILHIDHADSCDLISVTVSKIMTAGTLVKVYLLDQDRKEVIAHMSHKEFFEHPVENGQKVFIRPRRKAFVNEDRLDFDYVI